MNIIITIFSQYFNNIPFNLRINSKMIYNEMDV